ncbi:MAG: HAMP domain-containing histidine kinase, partial [Candidatus Omnitrophica bacterium]|nr:HAMP domain-containing histidine kinase [Candidatus Omnitrophota bacterium]
IRSEENYLQTRDSEKIKKVRENFREILSTTERSRSTFRSFMSSEVVNEIKRLLHNNETVLGEIFKLDKQVHALDQKLRQQGVILEEAAIKAMRELKPDGAGESFEAKVDKIALANKMLKEGYKTPSTNTRPKFKPSNKLQAALDEFSRKWESQDAMEPAVTYAALFQLRGELRVKMENHAVALHQSILDLENIFSKLLSEMNRKRDESKSKMMLAIFIAFVIFGSLILSVSFWITGILSGPILRLRYAMLQIAGGDLNATIDVHTPDEIGELAESFRTMQRKLKDSTDRLKKMDELKSRFIASAAHELKTPLTPIRGYVEIVLKEEVGPINPKQKEFLTYVDESAVRLQRLVKELLDISNIESGLARIAHTKVNLRDIVKEEVMLFKQHAEKKGMNFSLDLDPDLKSIYCDPDKIREALDNLISNAIKYTPAGGKISIFARNQGQGIQFGVQDSGIGIKKEDQERIFYPFQRIERKENENDEEGGTGLGLTLVKSIVEAHGGTIQVQSEENRGTVFTLYLPVNVKPAKLNEIFENF